MADYPSSVYTPRTKENLPGYPYTPANKYIGYSEDITYLENEVLAMIADMVGTGVAGGLKGAYATLSARLAVHDAMIPTSYLDTDGTLAANSDSKIASQKATKTYVDTKVPQGIATTDGPTFDHVHLTNGAVIGGSDQLRIWTYTKTLTTEEATNDWCNIPITAVTLAKVRSISTCGQRASSGVIYTFGDHASAWFTEGYLETTTNFAMFFGTSWVQNDKMLLTIIEVI
jgi:hypothetical protein